MAFSDWLIIGTCAAIAKKAIKSAAEDKERRERERQRTEMECQQFLEDIRKSEAEYDRRRRVKRERERTPCKFEDGITFEEFSDIAYDVANRIKRIKNVKVKGAFIFCTVESQTGYSDWDFYVNFNDWGHITGTYWKNSENYDSNIPEHFGDMVSEEIHQLLRDKGVSLIDFSNYVDENKDLGTSFGLSYSQKTSFLKKMFRQEKQVVLWFDSSILLGEHLFSVISILKSVGFKNIKSIPIKDVGHKSDKYIFEVEQIVINGTSYFEADDEFYEGAEIIITYHTKLEITIPYSTNSFRKKNYIIVGDQLQCMGFSNVYERKIKDLVTGWMTKDGSVEQVLVVVDNKELPMTNNKPYEHDVKVVITYHTFSK